MLQLSSVFYVHGLVVLQFDSCTYEHTIATVLLPTYQPKNTGTHIHMNTCGENGLKYETILRLQLGNNAYQSGRQLDNNNIKPVAILVDSNSTTMHINRVARLMHMGAHNHVKMHVFLKTKVLKRVAKPWAMDLNNVFF